MKCDVRHILFRYIDIDLFIHTSTNSTVPPPLSPSLITLLDPLGKRFMSATNDNDPAVQSPRTSFVSWKSHLKKFSGDALDGSSSASICYMLHAILVMIHVVLVIFYIFHWEHRVTLSFTQMNNDFWPVVLSVSLQAFYTIYTAVLLFLTQRLVMSRTLVRRRKLTAIHDILGSWMGLGSALNSLWQQIDISISWWMTFAVTVYLASMSVLHVTSSTLLRLQPFNTSISTAVPTTLAWPYNLSNSAPGGDPVNWPPIAASLPIFNKLPGVVSTGLSNTTVYDTPLTNAIVGNVTVNTTTITSRCGLIPNISYNLNYSYLPEQTKDGIFFPSVMGNFSIGGGGFFSFLEGFPWSDQIQVITPTVTFLNGSLDLDFVNETGVVLMVSTLLDIDSSVQETFAVSMPWNVMNFLGILEIYFIQCSLSTVSAEAVLDMQTNSLYNPVSAPQSSEQWEVNQWISNDWQSVISYALSATGSSGYEFLDTSVGGSNPSIADEYIMSLVGLNLATEYSRLLQGDLPIPTFVLSPDQLEAAIARVAAQLIWIAGKIGLSNGGLQPGNGMAYVDEEIIALRLNIDILPLSFAISASAIMMALALSMTRACSVSSNSQAAIQSTGALQLLWLGHHSVSVNEIMEDVEHPTEANLRRAGMIEVCFTKTISDQEELESSIDGLSSQIDHGRDDVI
ncbi:hypothetical protein F4604DRAFT_1959430 [Suillus subluteus]|nr:hypothetical protein F4604DRAFT_1959430 [Suillus subluteus]